MIQPVPFQHILPLKSTHPLQDATAHGIHLVMFLQAKIHASLAGCDRKI